MESHTNYTTFMSEFGDARAHIAAIKALMDAMPEPMWTLVAPDGRAWTGAQQDVARVLLQNIDIASLFSARTQEGASHE